MGGWARLACKVMKRENVILRVNDFGISRNKIKHNNVEFTENDESSS